MKSAIVHASFKTGGSDSWCTPDNVLDLVREVYGGAIGLDPATVEENPTGAQAIWTPAENGLLQGWRHNGGVFLNCPYSHIRAWMAAASTEARLGAEIIALVPVRTGARWWCESVWPHAQAVCFWKGRLRFKGAPSSAPFDSAVVYFGDRARAFERVLSAHGRVVTL